MTEETMKSLTGPSCLNGDQSIYIFPKAHDIEDSKADMIENGEKPDLLALYQMFKDVHAQRIEAIDKDSIANTDAKNEKKMSALKNYLKDLEDQNDTFVSVMAELEKEAHRRVKQMEKRLKSSAKTTMEAVINVHNCEKEIKRLVEEKHYIEALYNEMHHNFSAVKVENSFLRDQNFNLNHDIQSLLYVVQNARTTGNWEMNCITFCDVTPEQVFGPVQSIPNTCAYDSPQCQLPLLNNEKNSGLCSDVSSQDAFSSDGSSPSASKSTKTHTSEMKYFPSVKEYQSKIIERDKKIVLLNSVIAQLKHQMRMKEAEYEHHLWKLEIAMKQIQAKKVSSHILPSSCASLSKCFSLPDIGNIYRFYHAKRKSHSLETLNNNLRSKIKMPTKCELHPLRHCNRNSKGEETTIHQSIKNTSENTFVIRRGQSEPHLFMFGDNIYVYRPCEPFEEASSLALHDNDLGLPPCQSIDLKFPIEDELNSGQWSIFNKHEEDSVSRGSRIFIKENGCCSLCSSDFENEEFKKRCISTTVPQTICSSVQTENIAGKSIGLQISEHKVFESTVSDMDQNIKQQVDANHMLISMKVLKESLIKAEDRAEAKSMLIEQLQGHIASAVKEVELKDQALSNVENKLNNSRNECSSLKEELSELKLKMNCFLNDIENSQMLCDNLNLKLQAKEETIAELILQEKDLQDQKHVLLTELGLRGDELERTSNELHVMKIKIESFALQMEQQAYIIRNLQDTLVQTKRAFDAANPKLSSNASTSSPKEFSENRSSSRSSIVDI